MTKKQTNKQTKKQTSKQTNKARQANDGETRAGAIGLPLTQPLSWCGGKGTHRLSENANTDYNVNDHINGNNIEN